MKQLLPTRVWDNLATISVLGMLIVLSLTLAKVLSLSRDGKQAHDAICVLKGDLSQRINSSRDFLRDHPKGIPGIPTVTIRQGIANQQRTLDALEPVKCSSDERKG